MLSIFLLRLSHRASVSNCRLPSIWFWIKSQVLCHVSAHFRWYLYSCLFNLCFLMYRNLISWLSRYRSAVLMVLLSSMNGGIINSITKLHLVGYFYWFILRYTDPWILNLITDYPCPWRDSNPLSRQASTRRPHVLDRVATGIDQCSYVSHNGAHNFLRLLWAG